MKKSIFTLLFLCVGYVCFAQTSSLPTSFYGCSFGDDYGKTSGILQQNQYTFTVSELGNIIVQGQYGVLDTYFDGVSIWEGIMKFSENKFYDITLMTDNYTQEAATTLVGNFVSQFKQTYPNVELKQVNELPYGFTAINNNIQVVISLNEFNGSYQMVIRFVDLSI